MKKVLLVLVVIALMTVGFASDVELFGGPLFEYDANGFKFGYDAGANYGVDLGMKYSFLYANVSASIKNLSFLSSRIRTSVGFAFDLWRFRTLIAFGSEYSFVVDNGCVSVSCGGVPSGTPLASPLFVRVGCCFLCDSMCFGVVCNLSTPIIAAKNNLPDVFKVFKDERLRNYYLMSSSVAFVVQWRYRN